MEQIAAFAGGRVFQIALVVPDLDAALDGYASTLGEAGWRCYVFGTTGDHFYHGRPTRFSARLALSDTSPQMELIEPLEGDSIHRDWLAERGEGLHHVGVVVPSVERAVAAMADLGCPVIQSGERFGTAGDGAYAYFDAVASLGVILEAVEPPASGLPEPYAIRPR